MEKTVHRNHKGTEILNFEIPLNTRIFKNSVLHNLQKTRFDFITKSNSSIPIRKISADYFASHAEHTHTAGKMCGIFNVVEKVTLGQVSSPSTPVFPCLQHTHDPYSSVSLYRRCYISLVVASVVK